MSVKTLSPAWVLKPFVLYVGTLIVVSSGTSAAMAQDSGLYTDPATGIVYRKVQKTVERPVYETQVQTQESTTYRPETVVTTRPENRTVYRPVVSYGWEPRLTNRWNPFTQPTVVYDYKPRTHWEARTETVERREVSTNWVAETRKQNIPTQIVRMQREVKEEMEPVGRVAPPAQTTPPNSPEAAIAARLRPLPANTQVQPMPGNSGTTVASNYAAGLPTRNAVQSGLRANDLTPAATPNYSMPLPPASGGSGIAGLPAMWR